MKIFTAINELLPNANFSVEDNDYNKIIWRDDRVKPSLEAVEIKIAELKAAEPLRQLRKQRNQLLQQSDWMANSDVTMPTEWQTYRQALRDITTQSPSLDSDGNLTGITWPTPPND